MNKDEFLQLKKDVKIITHKIAASMKEYSGNDDKGITLAPGIALMLSFELLLRSIDDPDNYRKQVSLMVVKILEVFRDKKIQNEMERP